LSISLTSNRHPAGFDELMPKNARNTTVDGLQQHAHLLATDGTDSYATRGPPSRSGAFAEGDCQLSTITKEKALELYYQNPTFGMFLLRLLSGYALDDAVAGGRTSPVAGGRGRGPSGASTRSRWSDVEDS
jgi:hypothetical protein